MAKYQLELPYPLHPLWVSDVRRAGEFEAVVTENATVLVERQELGFTSALKPPVGTRLVCRLQDHLICVTLEKHQADQRQQEQAAIAQRVAIEQAQQAATELAKAFHKAYNIPFVWKSAIKERVKAISAARGGATAATVVHLLVDEDISVGRISRRKGDFLCVPARVSSTWNTSNQAHKGMPLYREGEAAYNEPVTCQKCLEMAQRWTAKE